MGNRNRKLNRRLAVRALALMLALAVSLCGLYSGMAEATVAIDASVTHEGVPVTEDHIIRMKADEASFPMPGGKTGGTCDLTIEGEGSETFPAMRFSAAGTYTYIIWQLAGDNDLAVEYDDSVYDLRIQVREGDGGLQVVAVMNRQGSEKKAAEAAFTDVYIAPAIVEDDPPVEKTVTGNPATAATFSFTMTAVSNTAGLAKDEMPMPDGAVDGVKTVRTKAGTPVEFGTLTFNQVGTYVYRVREVDDGQANYTYDTSVYTVTYTVTRDGDGLACERVIEKGGAEVSVSAFGFTNVYTGTDTPEPTSAPSSSGSSSSGSVQTGVRDRWPLYFGGAGGLLAAALVLLLLARKKKKHD